MKNQLIPVNQRPQDLKLAIVTTDSLPQTLNLLEHDERAANWHIRLAIIGESHRVRIACGEQFIMEEMLACVDVPSLICSHHQAFDDLQPHHFSQADYRVSIQFSHDASLWQSQEKELIYTFPEIDGVQAVTKIQWHNSENSFTWRTLHSYQNSSELLYVYSESTYIFK